MNYPDYIALREFLIAEGLFPKTASLSAFVSIPDPKRLLAVTDRLVLDRLVLSGC